MERYGNLSGNSGVVAYEIGKAQITVQFRDGKAYVYDYDNTGAANVEQMKRLAVAGQGLSGYISRFVRKRYAAKLG